MFSEKKRAKEKSTLFTKFSCFCEYHLLCLFRKITFIIFQVQSPFSLSVTLFFFFYPVKEFKPILWCFSPLFPYITLHFALWKAAQEWLTGQLTIYSVLQGTFHFFFYDFKEVFWGIGGDGESTSIHNQDGFVWLKIPPCEISLLRGNEQC